MIDRITKLWLQRRYQAALNSAVNGLLASGQYDADEDDQLIARASLIAKAAVQKVVKEVVRGGH